MLRGVAMPSSDGEVRARAASARLDGAGRVPAVTSSSGRGPAQAAAAVSASSIRDTAALRPVERRDVMEMPLARPGRERPPGQG